MSGFLKKNGAWIGFWVLAIGLALATSGGFLSPRNLTNLMRQASINGILAAGMTMVILTGGIDLSIGSIVAVAGVVAGISQVNWGWGALGVGAALKTIALAIAVGGFFGLSTGGMLAVLRIPPFVITLGMMVVGRGLAMILSNGSSIAPMGEALDPLANGFLPTTWTWILIGVTVALVILQAIRSRARSNLVFPTLTFALLAYSFVQYRGFPVLVLFLAGAMGLTGFILTQTTFGRGVYAIGSNERAAHWAGVPIRKITWLVYTAMGLLSGLAGVLLCARLNGADPNAGQLFELDAIAAVVIGGTSLKGGQGSIMGSFIGALTIAALNNGMDLLGIASFYQMVFKGAVIILAVSLDSSQRKASV